MHDSCEEMFNRHVNNAQIILDFPHAKLLCIDYKVINDSFLEHLREIHPDSVALVVSASVPLFIDVLKCFNTFSAMLLKSS